MRQDSYDTGEWKSWLDDQELDSRARYMADAMNEVLTEYFQSRENLPGQSLTGLPLISDAKTTDEIVDDVYPMMEVDKNMLVVWMRTHGFHLTTMADGSVKWAIWRDMKPLM